VLPRHSDGKIDWRGAFRSERAAMLGVTLAAVVVLFIIMLSVFAVR